jgi:transposase
MISAGPATRAFVALEPVDMRKGFDGLHGLVAHQLQEDPRSGHLFVFTNTQRTRLKILHWDGTGLWVCAKRLEKGRFSWPSPPQDLQGGKVRLTAAGLAMLLGGLDFAQARLKDWRRENE